MKDKEYLVVRLEVTPEVNQLRQIKKDIGIPAGRQIHDALKIYFKLSASERNVIMNSKA